MFKKANVVMLTTNEKATIGDVVKSSKSGNLGIYCKDKQYAENKGLIKWNSQHLYITSDEEIKEGDCWIYSKPLNEIHFLTKAGYPKNNPKYWLKDIYKVIASTDPTLNLPQPSPQFIQKHIEEYNKGNVINEVMVEYIDYNSDENYRIDNKYNEIKLKVNSKDNTITIKKIKDSWTREEVVKLIKEYHASFASYPTMNLDLRDNWISKKL